MKELDKFGAFFVQNFRDKALDNLLFLFDRRWKAPALQDLQNKIADLNQDQKNLVQELVDDILTTAMHDVLFAFQEYHDGGAGIEILVNDKLIAGFSDGLHGEIFGDDGWIKRYSKFPYTDRI